MSAWRSCHASAALAALMALAIAGRAGAEGAVPPHAGGALERLVWLAGCWSGGRGSGLVEEQWMPPRGGMMLGMGRTTDRDGGHLRDFEFLRIEARGDSLLLVALPKGHDGAQFAAVELGDSLAVFANPAHDFPQRIGYRLAADGGLTAWIEGTGRDGAARRFDFPLRRVDCPGAAPAAAPGAAPAAGEPR